MSWRGGWAQYFVKKSQQPVRQEAVVYTYRCLLFLANSLFCIFRELSDLGHIWKQEEKALGYVVLETIIKGISWFFLRPSLNFMGSFSRINNPFLNG